MGDTLVGSSVYEQDLGVRVDCKLNTNSQCDSAAKKPGGKGNRETSKCPHGSSLQESACCQVPRVKIHCGGLIDWGKAVKTSQHPTMREVLEGNLGTGYLECQEAWH